MGFFPYLEECALLITKPFVTACNLEFNTTVVWQTIISILGPVLPELPSRSADTSGDDLALLETVEVDTQGMLQTERDQGLMIS